MTKHRNENMGTPNHIEYLHLKEGEKHRHKSKCRYYDKTTKRCGRYFFRCIGSSHCDGYKEGVSTVSVIRDNPVNVKDSKGIAIQYDCIFINTHFVSSKKKVRIKHICKMGVGDCDSPNTCPLYISNKSPELYADKHRLCEYYYDEACSIKKGAPCERTICKSFHCDYTTKLLCVITEEQADELLELQREIDQLLANRQRKKSDKGKRLTTRLIYPIINKTFKKDYFLPINLLKYHDVLFIKVNEATVFSEKYKSGMTNIFLQEESHVYYIVKSQLENRRNSLIILRSPRTYYNLNSDGKDNDEEKNHQQGNKFKTSKPKAAKAKLYLKNNRSPKKSNKPKIVLSSDNVKDCIFLDLQTQSCNISKEKCGGRCRKYKRSRSRVRITG